MLCFGVCVYVEAELKKGPYDLGFGRGLSLTFKGCWVRRRSVGEKARDCREFGGWQVLRQRGSGSRPFGRVRRWVERR